MLLAAIQIIDVAFFVGKQLLIITAIYFPIIFLIRVSGYYKLNKCPECGNRLKRSSRSSTEHFANRFSFGILKLKRYRCYSCYWEGAAFQIPKNKSDDDLDEGDDQ
ncbi:MAG: hypothetical protein ACI9FU_000819 [Granulosicoccus sp.]|jgi:uncharacterized protein with PIN domain